MLIVACRTATTTKEHFPIYKIEVTRFKKLLPYKQKRYSVEKFPPVRNLLWNYFLYPISSSKFARFRRKYEINCEIKFNNLILLYQYVS